MRGPPPFTIPIRKTPCFSANKNEAPKPSLKSSNQLSPSSSFGRAVSSEVGTSSKGSLTTGEAGGWGFPQNEGLVFSKKSPTGPTERTHKPGYLIARSQPAIRGPLVFWSHSMFDGFLEGWCSGLHLRGVKKLRFFFVSFWGELLIFYILKTPLICWRKYP